MNLRQVIEHFLPASVTAAPEHERVRDAVREASLVQAQARQWALEVELSRRGRERRPREQV